MKIPWLFLLFLDLCLLHIKNPLPFVFAPRNNYIFYEQKVYLYFIPTYFINIIIIERLLHKTAYFTKIVSIIVFVLVFLLLEEITRKSIFSQYRHLYNYMFRLYTSFIQCYINFYFIISNFLSLLLKLLILSSFVLNQLSLILIIIYLSKISYSD